MAKRKRNPASKELLNYLFENYEIKSALDVQEALKDMFSETLENMLEAELDDHLGYEKHENNAAPNTNRRNGTSKKTVQSQLGEFDIEVPRDREASFEPVIVPKRQKDISGIEERVLSMYAKGQSQRDITATIQDIYGTEVSHDTIWISLTYSAKGCPYDNACIESFHAVLKKECVYLQTFIDYKHARIELFKYIEGFYNRKRKHSALGYKTPEQIEKMSLAA